MKTQLIVPVMAALAASASFGQAVISAKAGVIHYTEGEVNIHSDAGVAPVEMKTGGRYTDLKDGQELSTAAGRVEILLNPGVFLRLGEDSRIRMISTRLANTRLELLSGVALVEVAEVNLENSVTLLVNDTSVSFAKTGLVRIDKDFGVRVYKGEAQIIAGQTPQTLKEGRELQFTNGNTIARFDNKTGDPLYRWANRRAEYIAMANIASANMVRTNSGSMLAPSIGGWFYNPYFGMMTYLPVGNAMYRSPFGYFFFGPQRVGRYYQSFIQAPPPSAGFGGGDMSGRSWNANNGYYTTQSRTAGAVSLPAPSGGAAAPAAAPAARGADVGTARGGGGGGRGQ